MWAVVDTELKTCRSINQGLGRTR